MTITDLGVLAQRVHQLPDLVKQEAIECLLRNARLFQGLVQISAPVDTGNLRDHIQVRILQDGDIKEVAVVANTNYAAYVEAKYPFMAPAWAQVEPTLKAELEAIQQRIDKSVES